MLIVDAADAGGWIVALDIAYVSTCLEDIGVVDTCMRYGFLCWRVLYQCWRQLYDMMSLLQKLEMLLQELEMLL